MFGKWLKRNISRLTVETPVKAWGKNSRLEQEPFQALLFRFINSVVYFLLPLAVVWFPTLRSPPCKHFAFPERVAARLKVGMQLTQTLAHCRAWCMLVTIYINVKCSCLITIYRGGMRHNVGDFQMIKKSKCAWYYRKCTGRLQRECGWGIASFGPQNWWHRLFTEFKDPIGFLFKIEMQNSKATYLLLFTIIQLKWVQQNNNGDSSETCRMGSF